MPMVEIIQASQEPASVEQKRALTREVVEIFKEVLGTPDGRLRLFFSSLDWEDGIAGLLESGEKPADK